MAEADIQIHKFPQSKSINAVRFLPPLSAFDRPIVAAVHDPDSDVFSVAIHALEPQNPPNLHLQSSWPTPSRISSLRVSQTPQKPLIAASTLGGTLHILSAHPVEASIDMEVSIADRSFHSGPISGIDLQGSGRELVSVGEDGRVNLVRVGEAELSSNRVFDSRGLVSYKAARWASPSEFATGGLGFSLQWWDQRKPGGPVSQLKGDWAQGSKSGMVHSIDIHPSRKHVCMAGGSSGTVFAWDLRWQQQPVLLSGAGLDETIQPLSVSEVWEVQYDSYIQSSNPVSAASVKILPVMVCLEDGILAVLKQGEEPLELLAEPCAINCFDIDQQNPSDVICGLEWEAIAILKRP
ncbi:nuclear pore complex protein NUP43 [Cinnamomum micranthum f. kanehirae]|uniref:Nuclear pore complex protein NUP43 n=1 Tax=Cinnamomum micranthum f. kanehirae TaxID=337451 RepID=A0A3S3M937_9MAGN|nr:nuclear pore complex protein NUP43 [Cinnamomum micranthum f. kanehirae]